MFKEIYDRQFERVYRISLLLLKNPADAEDAAQTVFLKYLNTKQEFETLEHEKAWFITVARNTSKDIIKSAWKKRVDLPGEFEKEPAIEEKEGLLPYIINLPEKYREILYLYYYEGYKLKEIAVYTGTNESTVQSRLKAARENLKKVLIEEGSIYA